MRWLFNRIVQNQNPCQIDQIGIGEKVFTKMIQVRQRKNDFYPNRKYDLHIQRKIKIQVVCGTNDLHAF